MLVLECSMQAKAARVRCSQKFVSVSGCFNSAGAAGIALSPTQYQYTASSFQLICGCSMQARAAGVKCGDGVGEAGRASIQRLKDMGAVSLAEAKRKCPALQIRPMRTDRYRQVGLPNSFCVLYCCAPESCNADRPSMSAAAVSEVPERHLNACAGWPQLAPLLVVLIYFAVAKHLYFLRAVSMHDDCSQQSVDPPEGKSKSCMSFGQEPCICVNAESGCKGQL